jgi:hypothetical protein
VAVPLLASCAKQVGDRGKSARQLCRCIGEDSSKNGDRDENGDDSGYIDGGEQDVLLYRGHNGGYRGGDEGFKRIPSLNYQKSENLSLLRIGNTQDETG